MPLFSKPDPNEISFALKPTNGGTQIVNVVKDFQWTLSPQNQKAEVPVAMLREYQQNSGQLLATVFYGMKQFSNIREGRAGTVNSGTDVRAVYENLYFATPTGFVYALPYLGGQKFDRTNTFVTISNPFEHAIELITRYAGFSGGGFFKFGAAGSAVGGLAQTLVPGKVSMLPLESQMWDSTSNETITIPFDLFNTSGNTNEIRKNRELAVLLTHQNSPFRRSFAITDPPVVYDLLIPDVIHFPVCYVSSLSVKNLGNTRSLWLDGELRTIPEGYRFELTFTAVFPPTRNIFYGLDNSDSRVTVISTENPNQILGDKLMDLWHTAQENVALFGSDKFINRPGLIPKSSLSVPGIFSNPAFLNQSSGFA